MKDNALNTLEDHLTEDYYMLLRREVLAGGRSKLPKNHFCLMDEDCDCFDAPYYCNLVTGKCHPSREEGDFCGTKQTCFRGLICHEGRCRNETAFIKSDTCEKNRDCAYADFCYIRPSKNQPQEDTGICRPFGREEYCPPLTKKGSVDLEGGCYPENICVYQVPETPHITGLSSFDEKVSFEARGVCLRRCQVFKNTTALTAREEAIRKLLDCPVGFTCMTDWHLDTEGYYMVHGRRIPATEQVMALIQMKMGFCLPNDAVNAYTVSRATSQQDQGFWKVLGLVSFFLLMIVFGSAILLFVFRHKLKRKRLRVDPSAPPEYSMEGDQSYEALIHALGPSTSSANRSVGPSAPPPPAYHLALEHDYSPTEVIFDESSEKKKMDEDHNGDDIFT